MEEAKIAHLGFIQGIISRLAANSFLLKGWSVTLEAGLFALAAKDEDGKYIVLAFVPIALFWLLDAYFLSQEKAYRKLYDDVALNVVSSSAFTLNLNAVTGKVPSMMVCFFSKTLLPFYLLLVLLILSTTQL